MHATPESNHPLLIKPLLRGWSHVVAFFMVLVLGAILINSAAGTDRGPGLMIIYVVGTASMFGVSAAYHRLRWTPRARALMSKFDHCTIFWPLPAHTRPSPSLVCMACTRRSCCACRGWAPWWVSRWSGCPLISPGGCSRPCTWWLVGPRCSPSRSCTAALVREASSSSSAAGWPTPPAPWSTR
ncbi:MAG: hypothetical protein F2789_03715 [Actinobacteria bacterium]|nr:hypothetical protein [Actinomycetota bacterium]